MAFRWLLAVNIIAMIALVVSFYLGIKLKILMGRGRDTGPVKLLIIVIAMNGLLGLQFLVGGYLKYLGMFIDYVRLADVTIMVIGITLSVLIYRQYKQYSKLIKRNEPNL
jgi:hypothetical protein